MSMVVAKSADYIFGHPKVSCSDDSGLAFWIPVVQGNCIARDKFTWIDDRPELYGTVIDKSEMKWGRSEPNGGLLEPCVKVNIRHTNGENQTRLYDTSCLANRYCSICEIPEVQTYRLRGKTLLDHEYFHNLEEQQSTLGLTFEGNSSKIFWDPFGEKTLLIDPRYNLTVINQSPFGMFEIEHQVSGISDKLVFTNVSYM